MLEDAARDRIPVADVRSWKVAARDLKGKAGEANVHFLGVGPIGR
jgi:hypothetical protein